MKDSAFLHSSSVGFAIPSTYSLIAGGCSNLFNHCPDTQERLRRSQAHSIIAQLWQIPGNGHDVPRNKAAPRLALRVPRNRSDAPRKDPTVPRNAETVPGNIHRPRTSSVLVRAWVLGQVRL